MWKPKPCSGRADTPNNDWFRLRTKIPHLRRGVIQFTTAVLPTPPFTLHPNADMWYWTPLTDQSHHIRTPTPFLLPPSTILENSTRSNTNHSFTTRRTNPIIPFEVDLSTPTGRSLSTWFVTSSRSSSWSPRLQVSLHNARFCTSTRYSHLILTFPWQASLLPQPSAVLQD